MDSLPRIMGGLMSLFTSGTCDEIQMEGGFDTDGRSFLLFKCIFWTKRYPKNTTLVMQKDPWCFRKRLEAGGFERGWESWLWTARGLRNWAARSPVSSENSHHCEHFSFEHGRRSTLISRVYSPIAMLWGFAKLKGGRAPSGHRQILWADGVPVVSRSC